MLSNYFIRIANNRIFKSLSFFLPLIIVSSGLKIYGYVFAFILFLPNIIFNRFRFISFMKSKDLIDKIVIFYFFYLTIQSIIGAFYINDMRILFFWIPYFLVTFYCYFNNIYDLYNNKFYRNNFNNIILLSCIIYFLLYITLTIVCSYLYGNPFSIQDNIWVGSSVAFFISSILFLCIFKKWQIILFRFDYKFFLIIIIHNLFITIHQTRLGFLNLLLFGVFIFLSCIRIKKIINGILILSITFYSYSFFNSNIAYSKNYLQNNSSYRINYVDKLTQTKLSSNNIDKNRNILVEFDLLIKKVKDNLKVLKGDQPIKGDSSRLVELIIAKDHFNELSLYRKLLGTGWYTTRITINKTRNIFIDQNSDKIICKECFKKTDITQLSGFTSLLLDTGLIGFLFIIIFYFINLRMLFFSNLEVFFKLFYFSILGISFFCLFIGYPLVNIPFMLFFLPNRFLEN